MSRAPATKASAARDLLQFADKYRPGTRQAIFDRMPEESRAFIMDASRVSFIPIEHDHWVVDGLCGVLGVERAIDCWRASIPDMVDKPLLRNLVSGMLRVFGPNRKKIVSLLPRGWELVYKGYCTPRIVERTDERTVLALESIAPAIDDYPNYLHSWHGVCLGIFDLSRLPGEVRWSLAPDRRTATAEFVWG